MAANKALRASLRRDKEANAVLEDFLDGVLAGDKSALKAYLDIFNLITDAVDRKITGAGRVHDALRSSMAQRLIRDILWEEAVKVVEKEKNQI